MKNTKLVKRKLPAKRMVRRKRRLSDAETILLTIQTVITTALAAVKVLRPYLRRMKKAAAKRKVSK